MSPFFTACELNRGGRPTEWTDEEPRGRSGSTRRAEEWQNMTTLQLSPYIDLIDEQSPVRRRIELLDRDILPSPLASPDDAEEARTDSRAVLHFEGRDRPLTISREANLSLHLEHQCPKRCCDV